MKILGRRSLVVFGVALLTACSGGASAPEPASQYATRDATQYRAGSLAGDRTEPSWMRSPKKGSIAHVAVAQFGATSILWFKEKDKANKPPSVCEPAASTNGIRIDRRGNLWIPNGKAFNTTEYAPNCGVAELTIPDPDGEPADVGFDRSGNIYILNINNMSGPPVVHVYDASGNELRTLTDPSFAELFGVNSDNKGNVFVSNLTSGNVGNVVEFPHGKMPGTQLTGVSCACPAFPSSMPPTT